LRIFNISRYWAKDKLEKSLVEAMNRYGKQDEERKRYFFFIRLEKNTRQVSAGNCKTKPNTKLVSKLFRGKNLLLCLELKKPDERNVYEMNLFKIFNFSQSQETSQHHFLK